jgi:hypothetical protein
MDYQDIQDKMAHQAIQVIVDTAGKLARLESADLVANRVIVDSVAK